MFINEPLSDAMVSSSPRVDGRESKDKLVELEVGKLPGICP